MTTPDQKRILQESMNNDEETTRVFHDCCDKLGLDPDDFYFHVTISQDEQTEENTDVDKNTQMA